MLNYSYVGAFFAWLGILFLMMFFSSVMGGLFFAVAWLFSPEQIGGGVAVLTFCACALLLVREYVRG